jgi:hypothetical protein
MDFGLASKLESTEKLTHEGALLITPGCVAPEQARSQQADAKSESDRYALASLDQRPSGARTRATRKPT